MPLLNNRRNYNTEITIKVSDAVTKEIDDYSEWANIEDRSCFVMEAVLYILNSDDDWTYFKANPALDERVRRVTMNKDAQRKFEPIPLTTIHSGPKQKVIYGHEELGNKDTPKRPRFKTSVTPSLVKNQNTYGITERSYETLCMTIGFTIRHFKKLSEAKKGVIKISTNSIAKGIGGIIASLKIKPKNMGYSALYKRLVESRENRNAVYRVLHSLIESAKTCRNPRAKYKLKSFNIEDIIACIETSSQIIFLGSNKGVKGIVEHAMSLVVKYRGDE